MAGRSITLGISKPIKYNFEFGGGIRVNLNRIAHNDDQGKVFYKRLFATEPLHYFGIQGYINKNILRRWEKLEPFIFYDVQATYSTTRNRFFLPFTYWTDGTVLYKEHLRFWGPFTWLEQNIGIGFKANLFGNWFFHQKVGVGMTFVLGYEEELAVKLFNPFDWEIGMLLNVGVGYRFNRKKQ